MRVTAKPTHQEPIKELEATGGNRAAPLKLETDSSDGNAERMLQCLLQQSCTLQLGKKETSQINTIGTPAMIEGAKVPDY